MNNEAIVLSIKSLCKTHDITVGQLEKEIGLSQGLISKWIKTTPSLDKIVDIADYFRVSLDEIVGRTKPIPDRQDEFIDKIYDMTCNETLAWNDISDAIPQLKNDEYINDEDYDEEEMFIAKYQKGFFYIYGMYDIEYGKMTYADAQIYIRPDNSSALVLQDCNEEKTFKLWMYIRTKFYGSFDEVKAEELKNTLLDGASSPNSSTTNNAEVDYEKLLTNPEVLDFLKVYHSEEFQKMQQTFASPEFQKAISIASKLQKYFNKQ